MKAHLSFYGGVGSVTGANFLLSGEKANLLVDCGLIQGEKFADKMNRAPFPYEPSSIDYLLVTHAHIDHIGRIPKLMRDGFKGNIISTPETKELSKLMLPDAYSVMRSEVKNGEEPLYEEKDINSAFSLWETAAYGDTIDLGDFRAVFRNRGHILGSAMIEIKAKENSLRTIIFSGDLGNTPTPILKPEEIITGAQYIVMESVYGDRNHEGIEERKDRLAEIIKKTAVKKGVLLIPSFSLEKTQVLLYEMDDLLSKGMIPSQPVFLDSPLAIKITEVYKQFSDSLNGEAKAKLESGDDLFSFPNLHITFDAQSSSQIAAKQGPKIIIAGSGMSAGGRIVEHEKRYLGDENNTILFIGYQAVGSMGRQIQDGVKKVKINHEEINIRAKVETITGYSSHKDGEHLLQFVDQSSEKLEKVFVVMGEPHSSLFLAQRIQDYIGVKALVPELGEKVEISL